VVGAFRKYFAGELGGEVGDFVEVAVIGFEVFAVDAGGSVFTRTRFFRILGIDFTEGHEERFPVFLGFSFKSMGVEGHGRFKGVVIECCSNCQITESMSV
jgi:hypothetical protein